MTRRARAKIGDVKRLLKRLRPVAEVLRRHPRRTFVAAIIVPLMIGLPWFFLPKTVDFSYAGATCVSELTVLPQLHRTMGGGQDFTVRFDGVRSLGSLPIFATATCFAPTTAPVKGSVALATSVGGGWFLPQHYTIAVGDAPQVDIAPLRQPVPTTQPVMIPLTTPDAYHDYELIVAKKSTKCTDRHAEIRCDIASLALAQGETYAYSLTKQFRDDRDQPVSAGTLRTLRATKIVKSDIKNGQTVYAKLRQLRFTFDKPITAASASLRDGKNTYPVTVEPDGKVVVVKLADELSRERQYTLTLDGVEAEDGSTLAAPYSVTFATSGGPKVTSVSIGTSRVDPNAQAVITFDQDLSAEQDVASLVALKGGGATVTKLDSRRVAVQLQNLGRCVPFTISVAGGVLSKYAIKQKDGWRYSSRTICYTTSVYGSSLQGRPLVAYRFGDHGPLTLYTGAIHGNEISSKYMMESWVAELEAHPEKIGSRQIVIIPSVNPDGVAAGTRNNSRDVNVSRNFPTSNWVKDIDDTDGPNKGGGGQKPLSEPEAAALARYTQQLQPRLLVSYHAVGSLVIGDPGGYSAGKAAQYARLVGYQNATGSGGTFDYDITGSFEDWTFRNAGIPSMVVELGSYSHHNFAHHRAALWAMLE